MEQQRLMFKGDEPRGKRTLSSLSNFRAESTLNLIDRGQIRDIFVNSKNFPREYRTSAKGFHHKLAVGNLETIGDIKTILERHVFPHSSEQMLMFDDQQLKDSKTLCYYNIKKESTLQVTHKTSRNVTDNIGK